MSLSTRQIDSLLDLVEIKLGSMQVFDRDDLKEATLLKECVKTLRTMKEPAPRPDVVGFPDATSMVKSGRPHKIAAAAT